MSLIVLMSTYNGEKYLIEQLDSLLMQDLKPDRILIRDDGSKDNTVDILKDYASRYDHIAGSRIETYFNLPEEGGAGAW